MFMTLLIATFIAATVTFLAVYIYRAPTSPQHRFFLIALAVMFAGGIACQGVRHAAPDLLPPAGTLAGAFIMAIGGVAVLATSSPSWRGIALDESLFVTGWTLLLASGANLLLDWNANATEVQFIVVAALSLWVSLLLIRMARARHGSAPGEANLLFAWAALLGVGNLWSVASVVADQPVFFNVAQGCLVAGGLVLVLYLRTRTKNGYYTPARVPPRPRPQSINYGIGLLALITLFADLHHHMAEHEVYVHEHSWSHLLVMSNALLFVAGVIGRQIIMGQEYKQLNDHANEREKHYRSLVQNSSDVIVLVDPETRRTLYVSPAAEPILGSPPHDLEGRRLEQLVGADTHDTTQALQAVTDSASTTRLEGTRGQRVLETIISPHEGSALATVRDVTERDQLRRELHELAFMDPLTGLGNRHAVMTQLETLVAAAPEQVAVLFLDLDRFKQVNDTGGHEIGDMVLTEVSSRLLSVVDPSTTLGRMGGDEFVIILDQKDSIAERTADRIVDALQLPFSINGHTYQLGGSVGIAVAEPSMSSSELLRRADVAMYTAKRNRRRWEVYSDTQSKAVVIGVDRDATVARALRDQDFQLVLQPVVALRNGSVRSVESLVRWRDCDGDIQAPGLLLDFAKRTGQMQSITDWVLERSLLALQESDPRVGLAMNFPPEDLLNAQLPHMLSRRLEEFGVSPDRFTVEITEDEVISRVAQSTAVINQFREFGMKVVIDDFGSGYSSLAYLADLPISGFKVDRRFVTVLPTHAPTRSIMALLVAFAQDHDLTLVAEGIESKAEHECLLSLGCPLGQGYFYGLPQNANECSALNDLAEWTHRTAPMALHDIPFGSAQQPTPIVAQQPSRSEG